jgi:hypothetical protein
MAIESTSLVTASPNLLCKLVFVKYIVSNIFDTPIATLYSS